MRSVTTNAYQPSYGRRMGNAPPPQINPSCSSQNDGAHAAAAGWLYTNHKEKGRGGCRYLCDYYVVGRLRIFRQTIVLRIGFARIYVAQKDSSKIFGHHGRRQDIFVPGTSTINMKTRGRAGKTREESWCTFKCNTSYCCNYCCCYFVISSQTCMVNL